MSDPRSASIDHHSTAVAVPYGPPPDGDDDALRRAPPLGDVAAGVARGVEDADLVRDIVELAGGPSLPGAAAAPLSGLGRVARFGENLFGERQYASGAIGRVAAAAVETAAAEAGERVLDGAVQGALGGPAAALIEAVSAVDARTGVDAAPKLFTAAIAEGQPGAVAEGAASLLVDAGVAVAAGRATDIATVRGLQRDLVDGEYGAVLQGAAIAGSAMARDGDVERHLTSPAAAAGDRGVFVAWGNAAADLWADVVIGEARPPRVVPVQELERGGWGH